MKFLLIYLKYQSLSYHLEFILCNGRFITTCGIPPDVFSDHSACWEAPLGQYQQGNEMTLHRD